VIVMIVDLWFKIVIIVIVKLFESKPNLLIKFHF
jgi:hypothetical protein